MKGISFIYIIKELIYFFKYKALTELYKGQSYTN